MTLRTFTAPTGVTRDVTDTENIYAEDMNDIGAIINNLTPEYLVRKISVLFSDDGVPVSILTPASGYVLWGFQVEIVTPFDGSGTDLLDLGITGAATRYETGIDVSAGAGWQTLTLANIPDRRADTTDVEALYTDQNSDATAGQADVYLFYSIH